MILIEVIDWSYVEKVLYTSFLYSFHSYAFRQLSGGFLAAFRRVAGGFPAAFLENATNFLASAHREQY